MVPLTMIRPNDFLAKVERYMTDHGMSASGFGKAALGDPSFVFDLRDGRSVSLKTAERVIEWMDKRKDKAA